MHVAGKLVPLRIVSSEAFLASNVPVTAFVPLLLITSAVIETAAPVELCVTAIPEFPEYTGFTRIAVRASVAVPLNAPAVMATLPKGTPL